MKTKSAAWLLLICLLGGILMSGCTKKETYRIDYCGQAGMYENKKDSYFAGETVKLYFTIIGTDTDYSFFLDGESLNYRYDDSIGFVITFQMPAHDVTLEMQSHNSMMYDPDAQG